MKKIMFLILASLALVCNLVVAQTSTSTSGTATSTHVFDMTPVYVKTNYSSAVAETTGWLAVEPFRELAAVLQSTDSANADVFFDARNSSAINTLAYTTYGDSLKLADSTSGSANMNTGGIRNTLLKTTTLNRLNQPGNNQIRIRVSYRATLNGTTSGRKFRVWLIKTN